MSFNCTRERIECKNNRGISLLNIYFIYFIYLLNKDQNPATAGSARINAKEREKKRKGIDVPIGDEEQNGK